MRELVRHTGVLPQHLPGCEEAGQCACQSERLRLYVSDLCRLRSQAFLHFQEMSPFLGWL